jgi:hypothetical protein
VALVHSLHDVHKMNACRATHVGQAVRMILLENYGMRWIKSDMDIWPLKAILK